MRITLTDAGKRFNRDWIFRRFNYQFFSGKKYAITGPNGSGKSTLLQCIAGATMLTEGKLNFTDEKSPAQSEIAPEKFFAHISLAAPYVEVVEEMTASEFFAFHEVFKPFRPGLTTASILAIVGLTAAAGKQIRYYSSGMKQRVRLAQAFFTNSSVLLLDEPTTNLDAPGIALYRQLLADYSADRLVIISSNEPAEYAGCDEIIGMADAMVRPRTPETKIPRL